MTIYATINAKSMEIEISGSSIYEYTRDLGEMADAIPLSKRTFDRDRGVWVVAEWNEFVNVPFVRSAIDRQKLQLNFLDNL